MSIGYPLPDVEVRLVGADAPERGALEVRCPAVMRGYLNLPKVNAEVLNDGWYKTNDILRRDEHDFYYFVGRADDMFVCNGENVFPAAVETLLEKHPAVLQACVVPATDAQRGHVPIAFVVLRPGTESSDEELRAYTIANGPPVQHPRKVVFLDELPLLGSNKLDRGKLRLEAERIAAQGASGSVH